MAKLTWLGPDDYEEGETPPRSCTWAGITFPVGEAVEVDEGEHAHMVQKARGNRMFKVDDEPEQSLPIGLIRPETWTNTPPAPFPDFPPDYPPEDDREPLKRKRGRPPKVRNNGDGDQ